MEIDQWPDFSFIKEYDDIYKFCICMKTWTFSNTCCWFSVDTHEDDDIFVNLNFDIRFLIRP